MNHNKKTQVGNIGIMLGNWGERAAHDTPARQVQDKQDQGNPAHIVVLLEANEACAELLRQEAQFVEEDGWYYGAPPLLSELEEDDQRPQSRQTEKAKLGNVARRQWHQHHAIITDFHRGKQILMAARTNNCHGMTCLYNESWEDGLFRIKKKTRHATSTVMICKFDWKQNIGYIGLSVTVMAVHMHHHTANMKYSEEKTKKWWDRISELIVEHNPSFLLGDFNMSLTQVIPRLKTRGHMVDACSWYPWMKMDADESCRGYRLGVDSLGMFYIGGDVHCALKWDFDSIGKILKAAAWDADDDIETLRRQGPQSRLEGFDMFDGNNTPGQLWHRYKSKANDKEGDCTLKDKLEDLLAPSTTKSRLEELKAAQTWAYSSTDHRWRRELLPAYLKTREKHLDTREWLVNPEKKTVHNGAHKPLCVWLNNSSSRSQKAQEERKLKWPMTPARQDKYERAQWTGGTTAVAATTAGTARLTRTTAPQNPAWIVPINDYSGVELDVAGDDNWQNSSWSNSSWTDWGWSNRSWTDWHDHDEWWW